MPRYAYYCEECDETFQKVHSIKEKLTDCDVCKAEGVLRRVPSMSFVFSQSSRAGKLVKKHIEDAKREIKEEKAELKKVELE